MKKSLKLKLCNWSLLVSAVLVLASSIQLEATGSRGVWPVWMHVGLAMVFVLSGCYHVYLHFNLGNWFGKFSKIKNRPTRILWWLWLATVVTGLLAWVYWLGHFSHSHIGGIHGKIGFLMAVFAIGHTVKRIRFFKCA